VIAGEGMATTTTTTADNGLSYIADVLINTLHFICIVIVIIIRRVSVDGKPSTAKKEDGSGGGGNRRRASLDKENLVAETALPTAGEGGK